MSATEMVEVNKGGDETAAAGVDRTGTDETSFGGDDRQDGDNLFNASIAIVGGEGTGGGLEASTSTSRQEEKTYKENIKEAREIQRKDKQEKEDFINKVFKLNLDANDGPFSSTLFRELYIPKEKSGASFRGVKVFILKKGEIEYSRNQNVKFAESMSSWI